MEFLSPWPTSLILLVLSSLIFILVSIKVILFKKPSNLPPGPPQLPIIGNLHQLGKLPHRALHELSKRYGPVMHLRLGQLPTLVVSSPEMAKQVLKTHDLVCSNRHLSQGPKRLSYNFLDIAFGPYSDYWREIRKLSFTVLFSVKKVQSFGHVREEKVAQLMKSLSGMSGDGPVELGDRIFSLFANVLCTIAFGKTYEGRQFESGNFQAVVTEAHDMLSSFWGSDFFPYVGWIVDVLSGLHFRLEKFFHDVDKFYERVIEEHVDPTSNRKRSENEDITDILLRLAQDQTASIRLTRDAIKAFFMNIFQGGIDTGSITTMWAMTELSRNPRVMQKVQAEIRSHVGKNSKVDELQVGNLTYLKMVVKETLRLHPPFPLVPRESTQDCQIGGYNVYPKTRILVNVWAIGRDPEAWKNPDEFYPERFEGSEIDFRGQDFELLPFGSGRRICPGLTMGVTMVQFTLANLLHCFDWKLPKGMKPEDISLEEEGGLTVHKKLPLYLVPVEYKWQDYKSLCG